MSPRTDAFHKLVSELGPAVDGASTVTHAVAGAGAPPVRPSRGAGARAVRMLLCSSRMHAIPAAARRPELRTPETVTLDTVTVNSEFMYISHESGH